jgi:hypothetical protein
MILIYILIGYIINILYTRWVNKFLYEYGGLKIVPGSWFIPIIGPIVVTAMFFAEYWDVFLSKMKIKFSLLKEFLGDNWKENNNKQ